MTARTTTLGAGVLMTLGAILASPSAAATPPFQFAEGELLVKPVAGLGKDKFDKILERVGGRAERVLRGLGVHVVKVSTGSEIRLANLLSHTDKIAYAEPNALLAPVTADPNYSSQWHLPKMGIPTAWTYSSGQGVVVAVCDTGVNGSHPDLSGQVLPGWNTAANSPDTSDVNGHGTWVSGVIAAKADNGVGGASVAPNARILGMRITDRSDGAAYISDMAECITWAADNGARVANISYSGAAGSQSVWDAGSYMIGKGGVVVVAAANDNADLGYDNSPSVFTAAATTSSDARASYSNYGPYVDIAAPGSSIFTTDRSGGYATVSGTSFASPNAAATVALVMAANPTLTPADVLSVVMNTAVDLGDAGWDPYFGHGRVDAAAAAVMAGQVVHSDTTPPDVAILQPTTAATVSGDVSVEVQATDDFGLITSVELYDGESRITERTEQPGQPNVYVFSWNSTAVPDGDHELTAYAVDSAGNRGYAQAARVKVANSKDTQPPTVYITSPGSGTQSGNITLSANAVDDAGAVVELKLFADGELKCSGADSAACSWNLRKVPDGVHTVSATAVDSAGNSGQASMTFTIGGDTSTSPSPGQGKGRNK